MEWQSATIFISSTFNDMHAERDYLIKEVFPELTEWCEKRKIRLKDVDLRWGVTEEDSENQATVGKCLRHIDKSRPFFLCFLGQRRGWVPDFANEINDETKETYPQIKEIEGDVSVTEMEIEHALLSPMYRFIENTKWTCPPTKHTLFFFRDEKYLKELSASQREIYTNEYLHDENQIEHADLKLSEFKKAIIEKEKIIEEENRNLNEEDKIHVRISNYSGDWNGNLELRELSHLKNDESKGRLTNFKAEGKALKDVIIEQLKEQFTIAFKDNKPSDDLRKDWERDVEEQDNFCYLNREGFIPRPEFTQKLKDHVLRNDGKNRILLVSAKAGYGKTMLFADFAGKVEEELPDKKLYKRFCGTSDLSSRTFSLWKSIIDEAGIDAENEFYPQNMDDLKRNIRDLLKIIAERESIIMIDAVNQLSDGLDMLKWLSDRVDFEKWDEDMRNNLKIIISIKDDENNPPFNEKLDKIKSKKTVSHLELEGLDDDAKKELIVKYLDNYLKELNSEQINIICKSKASENPLFLKVLLSELRVFGSFDQLTMGFEEIVESFGDSPITAFNQVLKRLEEDEANNEGDKIAALIFSLLANARVGLSENELKDALKSETSMDEKSMQDGIRIILRQVRPFMTRKEGRHDFFYESFKIASQERYAVDKLKLNGLLADYFKQKADPSDDFTFKGKNIRDFNELPYHLKESGEIKTLEKVLGSYLFIRNKLALSDIYNLIIDYQLFESENDEDPIKLIERALELSAPVLTISKEQLPSQLQGRMNEIDDEIIENLLLEMEENTREKWLKSGKTVLYSPKSSIIKIIKAGGKTSCDIAAANNKIIIANSEGTLSLYDTENNSLESLEEGNSEIIKIILNEEEDEFISVNANGMIKIWNISNQSVSKSLPQLHESIKDLKIQITDAYYSKTYDKIYASSHKGVYSLNLKTEELRREKIEFKDYNHILVPSMNETIFLSDDKEVDGWNIYNMLLNFNQHHQHEISSGDAISGSFTTKADTSGDIRFMGLVGRFLILISENGQMKIWNSLKTSSTGESIDEVFTTSLNDQFAQAVTLEEKNQIITVSKMGLLSLWNIPKPQNPVFNREIEDIQTGISSSTAIDYLPESNWLLIGNDNNEISIIDLDKEIEENKRAQPTSLKTDTQSSSEIQASDSAEAVGKHTESVLFINMHENEMITASENGEIFIWDLDSEMVKREISNTFRNECVSYDYEQKQLVSCGIQFNKDGTRKYMASIQKSGGEDAEEINKGNRKIVDVGQNSRGIVYLEEEHIEINGEKMALNGKATALSLIYHSPLAFIGYENGRIDRLAVELELFDSSMSHAVTKIKTHDKKLFASYSDGSICIFDFAGNLLKTLKEHSDSITSISIHNNLLASVSKDNTLKLWDIDKGECIYTYYLNIFASSVHISNDRLVIGDALGNINSFSFMNF